MLYYKCSKYRHQDSETGILWNDRNINIKWPSRKPIVSEKDKKNLSFDEFIKKFIIK